MHPYKKIKMASYHSPGTQNTKIRDWRGPIIFGKMGTMHEDQSKEFLNMSNGGNTVE